MRLIPTLCKNIHLKDIFSLNSRTFIMMKTEMIKNQIAFKYHFDNDVDTMSTCEGCHYSRSMMSIFRDICPYAWTEHNCVQHLASTVIST